MKARTILDLRRLGKRYPGRNGQPAAPVLEELTFSVAEGEFVTILGPSGAGKTTLLNVLAQVDAATEGELWFDGVRLPTGVDAVLEPGLSCRVGYVTQDDLLLPWRTTLENVLLPLELQRRLRPNARDYAHALIRAVGLEGFEHHYPHELSGGMRKRASLIRTLVYDPPVIVMDEPFGALDVETRVLLQEDLLRLWTMGNKTIVFVTHDIGEAIALGDRTLVLSAAPARVRAEHVVPLPRPRPIRELPIEPAFVELYRTIRRELEPACAL